MAPITLNLPNEKKDRIISNSINFAIFGAVVGVLAVVFFGILGTGTIALIFGAVLGAFIGGIIGIIFGLLPEGFGRGFMLTMILIVFVLLGAVIIGYSTTGVAPAFFGEASPKLTYAVAVVGDKFSCFAFWNEVKFRECWMPGGWNSETQQEVIALDVEFKTPDLYYDGKEKEIVAEIKVNNVPEKGTAFTIEPKCFIDNKEAKVESYGTKEGDKLVFYERDAQQKASVRCIVPPEMISGKNKITAKIELVRPVIQNVEWAVYTIRKEYLDTRKDLPGNIFEGEGKSVSYMGVPYDFGIGVDESVPLTEGKHSLYIRLKKGIQTIGVTDMKSIEYLRVGGGGETASITSCDEFKGEGEAFAIKNVDEQAVLKQGINRGKTYSCIIEVSPISATTKEVPYKKVTFNSAINYQVGFKKESSVLILTAGV